MIETYGVLFTDTASAVLAWGGFGYVENPSVISTIMPSADNFSRLTFGRLLWLTIRYGDRLRAVMNVGFSTAENN
jgi:hypothetical protein